MCCLEAQWPFCRFVWLGIFIMANGYSERRISARWRARCMLLVLLLELSMLAIGTASFSNKDNVDQMVSVDQSLTPGKVCDVFNSYPALQEFEVHSTRKDSSSRGVVGSGSRLKSGLLNVLQRLIGQFWRTTMPGCWPLKGSHDHNRARMKIDAWKDYEFASSGSRSRRLLLTWPGYAKKRSASPTVFFRAALDPGLDQPHEIHNEGRRVLADTTSSSQGVPVTQQVLLGPPAPPDLVKNEKQDWNQDYAEPDVHPPSSN